MTTTFLSGVNLARLECGITSGDLTTLTGLTGKNLQIKNWYNRAWQDVQRAHANWRWMRSSFSFATVANQQDYTPVQANAANYGRWLPNTFRIYVTSLGYPSEMWMSEWDWETFRNLYVFGAQRTVAARPVVFAIKPNKSISVGPPPNATGYTVLGDYYTSALPLVNDTDVPGLPDQFADIIMHKTKVYYGQEEAATEVYESGKADFDRMMAELECDQLDDIDLGGPLA